MPGRKRADPAGVAIHRQLAIEDIDHLIGELTKLQGMISAESCTDQTIKDVRGALINVRRHGCAMAGEIKDWAFHSRWSSEDVSLLNSILWDWRK